MRIKRILSLFLLLLLVLVPVAAARAEGDTCPSSDDGQHNWVVYENPPTCTDPGMREYPCTKCYASRDYETLPALGHDYVERVDKAATCTEAGHAYRSCSRCSDMQEVTLPALGHTWDNGVVTQAPTCAAEGVMTFTCLRCGATRTEAIAKTADHIPVSVPGKAATCTEAGLTDGSKCSVCGAVLTAQQSIPAKGHSPVAVPGRAATCTEAGLTDGSKCSVCGAVLTAQQSIPALGHAWDGGAVTVAPTCVDKGYRTNTCTRCGATELTGIPPTGEHTWDEGAITAEPTGLTPGVKTFTCTVCGATKTENVDPTKSLFWGMNSGGVPEFNVSDTGVSFEDFMNGENLPLVIIQQPEGGIVPHDKSDKLVLTVAATGGEGAYTYEWFYQPQLPTTTTFPVLDLVFQQAADFNTTVSAAKGKTDTAAAQALQSWHQSHGILLGTVDKTTTATQAETMTAQPLQQTYNPLAEGLGSSSYPECDAWSPGTYWCVVHDEAGHTATSDKAEVGEELYIARQPESKNIYGLDTVTLTCMAKGGSGDYLYTWYDDKDAPLSNDPSFPASEVGQYRCLVVDYITMETAESQIVLVYSGERDLRPVITLQPESVTLIPQEDGQYSWSMACLAQTFDGGSEDLQYDWYGKTDAGWAPIASGNVLTRSYDNGTFRCKVTDKRNGEYVSSNEATVQTELRCTITAIKPDWGADAIATYKIEGGKGPYKVKLYKYQATALDYHDTTEYQSEWLYSGNTTVDSEGEHDFKIWDAIYPYPAYHNGVIVIRYGNSKIYLTVTDDLGNTCESNQVWCKFNA